MIASATTDKSGEMAIFKYIQMRIIDVSITTTIHSFRQPFMPR